MQVREMPDDFCKVYRQDFTKKYFFIWESETILLFCKDLVILVNTYIQKVCGAICEENQNYILHLNFKIEVIIKSPK